MKQKCDWTPWSVLRSKRVYLRKKPKQYSRLTHKLLSANMVTMLPSYEYTIENFILGFWKKPGISQWLIWAGNRSNLFFNSDLSGVKLPSPDLVSSVSQRGPPAAYQRLRYLAVLQKASGPKRTRSSSGNSENHRRAPGTTSVLRRPHSEPHLRADGGEVLGGAFKSGVHFRSKAQLSASTGFVRNPARLQDQARPKSGASVHRRH